MKRKLLDQINGYRSDIDGLRAVAVISVILFHLDFTYFSGGYVGVDVFFVISGYLITGIIKNEMSSGTFSLSDFFVRRIRRLAPALILVTATVSTCAYFLLKPEAMKSFGLSLAFQFISLQNIVFLLDGEYFVGSSMKPLLHTWSLAVEEQFYILWPLIMIGARRFSLKKLIILLTLLITSSFMVNLELMTISPKSSFFLLPSRAWELAAGCFIALLERQYLSLLSIKIRFYLAAFGLLLIFFSICTFTKYTEFPSYSAILPVLGAALIITSNIGKQTAIGEFLSHPIMVRIGLISYPMYLWHWPIISLSRQFKIDQSGPFIIATIIIVTVIFSEFTYQFLELPIRRKKWFSEKCHLLTFFGICFALCMFFGVHTYLTDGAAYRYGTETKALLTAPLKASRSRCDLKHRILHPTSAICQLNKSSSTHKRILLWGNSHAAMWSTLFLKLGAIHNSEIYINASNCRATIDSESCDKSKQDAVFEKISEKEITDVVLASTTFGSYDLPDKIYQENFESVVRRLANNNVNIWIVIDTPDDDALNPVLAYEKNPINPKLGEASATTYLKYRKKQQVLFNPLVSSLNKVKIIDPSLNLCGISTCSGGKNGIPWYTDSHHLSEAGAFVAEKQFLPIFIDQFPQEKNY